MATLVLTAVGTAIGGPIGGAIGALVGSQIDSAIFRPDGREGPRLKELGVSISSYGTPIPRHFGTMRASGSIIWATDLVESSEESGGGKGQPSTTTYSYSSSFAVALSSRPIEAVGRIWADGNLLRGAAGDLKVGGSLRIYRGHGDQRPDPLIAAAEGAACPAFRGLAYCVFEDLQLGDFGNRLPALTFEILAGEAPVELTAVIAPVERPVEAARELTGLVGFSDEGGALATTLRAIDQIYPLFCDAGPDGLSVRAPDLPEDPPVMLPEPVVAASGESFGEATGIASRRQTGQRAGAAIRYYDIDRDYQPGLQYAARRASPGRQEIVEFPGALRATTARQLIENAAKNSAASQDRIAWRIAQLDPALRPGQLVQLPDRPGAWRVVTWEWREDGIELDLRRMAAFTGAQLTADTGRVLSAPDRVATPTVLMAFELPWDGEGTPNDRQLYAAASSQSAGWTGAALYAEQAGSLLPLGTSGSRRAVVGSAAHPLPGASATILDRHSVLEVQLTGLDLSLSSATFADLAQGANRALVGDELLQFARAQHLGNGLWRLSELLRGRGGTEAAAAQGALVGADFALLDQRPVKLDGAKVGSAERIAAIGLADATPEVADIAGLGRSLRPLVPVHPRANAALDGGLLLCWTRRARGAWFWSGTVEPALVEQSEMYQIGLGDTERPLLAWQTTEPRLLLDATAYGQLQSDHAGEPLWVRQIGSHDRSPPLFLTTIS